MISATSSPCQPLPLLDCTICSSGTSNPVVVVAFLERSLLHTLSPFLLPRTDAADTDVTTCRDILMLLSFGGTELAPPHNRHPPKSFYKHMARRSITGIPDLQGALFYHPILSIVVGGITGLVASTIGWGVSTIYISLRQRA